MFTASFPTLSPRIESTYGRRIQLIMSALRLLKLNVDRSLRVESCLGLAVFTTSGRLLFCRLTSVAIASASCARFEACRLSCQFWRFELRTFISYLDILFFKL